MLILLQINYVYGAGRMNVARVYEAATPGASCDDDLRLHRCNFVITMRCVWDVVTCVQKAYINITTHCAGARVWGGGDVRVV